MAGVTMFSVLDLEEGPGERAPHPHPPPLPVLGKKKNEIREGKQAGRASKTVPPAPPLGLGWIRH